MKIICGTDFSVHAAQAANVAAALAARSNGQLTLLHAPELSGLEFLSQAQVDHWRAHLRRKLTKEENRLRPSGANVLRKLVLGRPHEVLASSARQFKADLIVVSSIGQIAPSRWLIGSVAERTAQNSPVPTLMVRDHQRLTDWIEGRRKLNVFVGYDFSESSDAALRWAASLSEIAPCNITVTYLSWPPSESWRFGVGYGTSEDDGSPEAHAILERDLQQRCDAMLGKTKARIDVVSGWGRQDECLVELAKAGESDLIVVGTNQRRGLSRFWLGSVSRGILHRSPTNVTVVPMSETEATSPNSTPVLSRVLVPTDFSKQGDRAVAYAYGTVRRGGEVGLVHVIPPVRRLKPDSDSADGRLAERKKALAARLRKLVPRDAGVREIVSRVEIVEHRQPAVAICQAAERSGADLICIGSHGRSGIAKQLLGSVTKAVMKRSDRPVLVVRS